jgi:hypothetical protein
MIIRGGYNVYPREIEEVLYEHPDMLEAAVIAIPHDELGEEVAAAVALKPGAHATPGELRDFVKQRIAAYKYPRLRLARRRAAQRPHRQGPQARDQTAGHPHRGLSHGASAAGQRWRGVVRLTAEPEAIGRRGVLVGMPSLLTDTLWPLTLSEQLDAMPSGWLDRHAPDGNLGPPTRSPRGVVTDADVHLAQVEAFCARWDLTVRRTARGDGRWAVLVVEGRELPIRGFLEITAMYRR